MIANLSSFCQSARGQGFACLGMLTFPLVAAVLSAPIARAQTKGSGDKEVPMEQQGTGEELISNERIRALDGSRSAWSGQFQATYNGSTLNHPFSADAPNPGHFIPPPVVLMTGTLALRYRIDEKTNLGAGSGIGTETPLQGPKNTRMSDPYVDMARTWVFGPVRSRVSLSGKYFSNHQYHDIYGYREGLSLYSDSYVEFLRRWTLGLTFNAYKNYFAAGDYPQSSQVESQFYVDPVLEYRINSMLNIRTVMAITLAHTRDLPEGTYVHSQDFQMLGLGIAATRDLYLYVYTKFFPYTSQPVTPDRAMFCFNVIVNLF